MQNTSLGANDGVWNIKYVNNLQNFIIVYSSLHTIYDTRRGKNHDRGMV